MLPVSDLVDIAILIEYPLSIKDLEGQLTLQENKFGSIIFSKISEILQSIKDLDEGYLTKVIGGQDNLKKAGSLEWFPQSAESNSVSQQRDKLTAILKYLVGYVAVEENNPTVFTDGYDMRTVRG